MLWSHWSKRRQEETVIAVRRRLSTLGRLRLMGMNVLVLFCSNTPSAMREKNLIACHSERGRRNPVLAVG